MPGGARGKGEKEKKKMGEEKTHEASTGKMGNLPSCCTYGGLRKTEPGHMEMSWKIQLFPLPSSRSWAPKVFVHTHHTNPPCPSPAAAAPLPIPLGKILPAKTPKSCWGSARGGQHPKNRVRARVGRGMQQKNAPRPSNNNLPPFFNCKERFQMVAGG